jgi:glycosyltransferase involved in cell wall biosynthesis
MGALKEKFSVTFLMPCLNEAETLDVCIKKSLASIASQNLDAEILIADNGSTDGSLEIARVNQVRVVHVEKRGYGAALIAGIEASTKDVIIMGDADDSYAWDSVSHFLEQINLGADLVIGNRFKGGIEKDAMPFLHKYLGNPVLSFLGRLFFKLDIGDFHCGLRAFRRESVKNLKLKCTGMEFASEMIVKSKLANLRIDEVPTTLKKDGRSRPPHLRTWRDGWRHLKFLLMFAPNWLFAIPGFVLMTAGAFGAVLLRGGPLFLGEIRFGLQSLVFSIFMLLAGTQIISFWVIARELVVKILEGESGRWFKKVTDNLDLSILFSSLLFIFSSFGVLIQFVTWANQGYGPLDIEDVVRQALFYCSGLVLSLQLFFMTLVMGVIDIDRRN